MIFHLVLRIVCMHVIVNPSSDLVSLPFLSVYMADLQSAGLPVSQGPRSMMALFGGDDADTMPLWFNKGAFTASDFSSEAYIADLRKFVPLDTLRTELRSHLRLLKSELVELINRDYADFVNLSTKLVDVDGAVLRMRTPLNDLRSRLSLVKESVKASLSALQDGLHRRAEASQAREILELLLDTSHVVSKVYHNPIKFSSNYTDTIVLIIWCFEFVCMHMYLLTLVKYICQQLVM